MRTLYFALLFFLVGRTVCSNQDVCSVPEQTAHMTKLVNQAQSLYRAEDQNQYLANMQAVISLLRDTVHATSSPPCTNEDLNALQATSKLLFAMALMSRHEEDSGEHEELMMRSFENAFALNASDWVSSYALGMFLFNVKTEPHVGDKLSGEHLELRRRNNFDSPQEALDSRSWLHHSIAALQINDAGTHLGTTVHADFEGLPLLINPLIFGTIQQAKHSLFVLYESVLRYFGEEAGSEAQRWAHGIGVECGVFHNVYQRPSDPTAMDNSYTSRPFFDASLEFPNVVRLLEDPKTVRVLKKEGMKALHKSYTVEDMGLHFKGTWKELVLFRGGQRHFANCAVVPKTCTLLERLPLVTRFEHGQIKFSHMKPGTASVAHCGPTNRKLRLHLGLVVPEACGITVGNETTTWAVGQALLFDDSFEHYVWNNASSGRLVLIVDLPHPKYTQMLGPCKAEDVGESPVVCGGHMAECCAACPQGNGESWCHGQCMWQDGECVQAVATASLIDGDSGMGGDDDVDKDEL